MARSASLPLAPLERIARVQADLPVYDAGDTGGTFNDQVFADMIGVSSRAISRWRVVPDPEDPENTDKLGRIPWPSADQAAIMLGLHPYSVWGDDWLAMDYDVIYNGKDAGAIKKALNTIGTVLEENAKLSEGAATIGSHDSRSSSSLVSS